jgi:hypothetical protein
MRPVGALGPLGGLYRALRGPHLDSYGALSGPLGDPIADFRGLNWGPLGGPMGPLGLPWECPRRAPQKGESKTVSNQKP